MAFPSDTTYGKLLDNGGSALGSRGLESQHGLLALFLGVSHV